MPSANAEWAITKTVQIVNGRFTGKRATTSQDDWQFAWKDLC
jgi:hypothetical protein